MTTSFQQPESDTRTDAPTVNLPGSSSEYLELCSKDYPEAKRAALFSIIPGIGQIRNGEIGKGSLFLIIFATNIALVLCCLWQNQTAAALTSAAIALHRQPNWDLSAPLVAASASSPARGIYIALILAFVAYAIRDAYDGAVQLLRSGKQPPKFILSLPEAASGSYLVHFSIIAAFILMVVCFVTPQPQPKQIIQIELTKPKVETPKPQHHEDAPKPKVQPPKPIVQPPKQVKVEPPKPQPVAVSVPTNVPTPISAAPVMAAPAEAPSPPAASNSAGSGTGSAGAGDAEIDMGPYMKELQKRIKKSWFPPKGEESKQVKVSFQVHKDGTIRKLKLTTSSGFTDADEAAMTAVQTAAPFAPLPDGVGDDIDINFGFDYTVFGTRR